MSGPVTCSRRYAGRRLPLIAAALAAVAFVVSAEPLRAQEGGLSKSALVRVVVSADAPADKVATVRSRCLSFEPTEGDWQDLRNLGASEELIDAARRCAADAQAVTVALSASRTTVRAGDTTLVTVDLSRAREALSDQSLTLTGAGGPGAGDRITRTTNASGRAFFSIPAGESLGATRYTVAAPGVDLTGPTRITITTVPDVAAAASTDPAALEFTLGAEVPEVAVDVRDRFDNPVSGLDVELIAGTEADAPVVASATTGTGGSATLRVEGEPPSTATTWGVRGAGIVLATIPVSIDTTATPADPAVPVAAAPAQAPIDAAVSAGLAQLAAGEAELAEQSFRDALRLSPRRADAQKGLAESLLAQGREEAAVTWYEVATRQSPMDADAWDGLGRAYSAAGRRDDAATAFARAQEIDPSREELQTEIADLSRPPGYVTGTLWGGSTSGNDESGGLRRAALDVAVSPAISLRGGWDRSLVPRSPELVRGPDEWNGWYAGGALRYGAGRRLETSFDLGQRKQTFSPVDESASLEQNLYRLTQTVRFSDQRRTTELKFGGYLGRWFDRDDWIVFTRLKTPIGRQLSLVASGSYGENIGNNWVESGRHADKDGRVYAGVAWETEKGFLIQPVLGLGSVSSDRSDDLSGSLVDLLLEAAVPISRGAQIQGFVRHQRPPGIEAYTTFALGLGFRAGWAGG